MATNFELNGETRTADSAPDTPLLYVLSDEIGLAGPRYGCGLAQCGSCSVLVDGAEMRSCVTPLAAVEGRAVTTLEGLPARHAARNGAQGGGAIPDLTPVQRAMLEAQAPQCGYCYNGMVVKATELLEANPNPSEAEIVAHMDGHLCRCGTYPRIVAAIRAAAQTMAEG
jgi:aerobic-type carbon monoxide dehydrogenase small subunit (CoxS/CutS family)